MLDTQHHPLELLAGQPAHAPLPVTAERNDAIRYEQGVLAIESEEFFSDGASQYATITVYDDDTVRLNLVVAPAYPSERPARHALGEMQHPALAQHIRTMAMPLVAAPQRGVMPGVNLLLSLVLQIIPLRPHLTLCQ